jgi:hypothetical protein
MSAGRTNRFSSGRMSSAPAVVNAQIPRKNRGHTHDDQPGDASSEQDQQPAQQNQQKDQTDRLNQQPEDF